MVRDLIEPLLQAVERLLARLVDRGALPAHDRSVLARTSGKDLNLLAGWLSTGQLRPVVERAYPLADAAEAHRRSQSGRVRGKWTLVVDPALAAFVPPAVASAL